MHENLTLLELINCLTDGILMSTYYVCLYCKIWKIFSQRYSFVIVTLTLLLDPQNNNKLNVSILKLYELHIHISKTIVFMPLPALAGVGLIAFCCGVTSVHAYVRTCVCHVHNGGLTNVAVDLQVYMQVFPPTTFTFTSVFLCKSS